MAQGSSVSGTVILFANLHKIGHSLCSSPFYRLWSDPDDDHDTEIIPKETFSRLSIIRNRLVGFGIEAEPLFPKYCAQNQDECL